MGNVRSFRDDDVLKPKLDALKRNELSRIIRDLLYGYFFGEQKPIMYYPQSFISEPIVDNTPVEDFKLDMFD